jgi:hypothetical protein
MPAFQRSFGLLLLDRIIFLRPEIVAEREISRAAIHGIPRSQPICPDT